MENFIDTSNAIYIALEYMPGGTLKQLIESKTWLKEPETKIILYQVSRAVQYLHHRSIAHRDLKVTQNFLTFKMKIIFKFVLFYSIMIYKDNIFDIIS